MFVHLTRVSRNEKTGPIPVSTTSEDTCPDSCPFKNNGCYASYGPLKMHWAKVSSGERTSMWKDFLDQIKRLPKAQLWRHNQAGDLPGEGDSIDRGLLQQLTRANRGRRGFTYTHKPPTEANLEAIREANEGGFTVNLSANSLAHADELLAAGAGPVVAVVAGDAPRTGTTPGGARYITCPAQLGDTDCNRCGLCQSRGTSRPVIAFRAHGTGRKRIEATLA